MKNKWLERIGLICLLVTLLTLAITLTINARWLYQFDIGQLDLLDYTSLSEKELLHNFDRFFVMFHGVFFNNDAWIFNPATDPIINVLPETFFLHCFILFFILLEIFYLLPIYFGKRALKKER